MLLAATLSATQLILVGGSMLVCAFLLRRTSVLRQRSQANETSSRASVRTEPPTGSLQAGEKRLRDLELRLFDYDRDVQARVENTLTVLDQLVLEAERQSSELQSLLQSSQSSIRAAALRAAPDICGPQPRRSASGRDEETATPPLTPAQTRMIGHLLDAGYSLTEVAELTGHPIQQLRKVPLPDQRQNRRDAA